MTTSLPPPTPPTYPWASQPYTSSGLYSATQAYPTANYYTAQGPNTCHPPAYPTSAYYTVAQQRPALPVQPPPPIYGFAPYVSPHYYARAFSTTSLNSTGTSMATIADTPPPYFAEESPPPHVRPLYATIPLPNENDSPVDMEAYPLPTKKPPTSHDHKSPNVHFHVSLRMDRLCPKSPRSEKSSAEVAGLSPDQSDRNAPATTPSVGSLTRLADTTGQMLDILPSSPISPHLVTVGDSLDAIETTTSLIPINDDDAGIRPDRRGLSLEKLSNMASSVKVWCRTKGGGKETKPRRQWRLGGG